MAWFMTIETLRALWGVCLWSGRSLLFRTFTTKMYSHPVILSLIDQSHIPLKLRPMVRKSFCYWPRASEVEKGIRTQADPVMEFHGIRTRFLKRDASFHRPALVLSEDED
ncbi:hypothetical protein CAPTEDRAFT_197452 [Capitella teleta]|uniref:Uncharacterized protein n=1 Tax=Capitella teleta TaxID=283909 RepID=R7TH44_CAPTE|nr:hypothetical protein CAPTEDRAFT_197452 [Capitella teleta]|eukprot:ELT90435.1 hypothetical protein CAPTEDRAFT_197452 [Capitella teleta]